MAKIAYFIIFPCNYDFDLSKVNFYPSNTPNWLSKVYSGNPNSWCNSQIPNPNVSSIDTEVGTYSGSTGCCLIPKHGEINYYDKDKQNFFLLNCNILGDKMSNKVNIIIEKDNKGYYAFCPELDGCQSQGDSFEEIMTNIKEAIELYIETLTPDERVFYLSKDILTTTFEVKVA